MKNESVNRGSYSPRNFFGWLLCTIGIHKYIVSESIADMALLECERCEFPKAIKIRR